MYAQHILFAIVSAVAVSAVPLNINLGAYSPALVVGDGEISLGGAESASSLMQTLATGAAANEAAAAAAQQPAAAPAQEGEGIPAAAAAIPIPAPQEQEAPAAQPVAEGAPATAGGSPSRAIQQGLEPAAKLKFKRDIEGFRTALGYATEAMKNQPQVDLGTEASGIGILVNPGVNVAVDSAANGVNPAGAESGHKKRDLDAQEAPEEKKRGITLIALAEI